MKLEDRIEDVFMQFNNDILFKLEEEIPLGVKFAILGMEECVLEIVRLSTQSMRDDEDD